LKPIIAPSVLAADLSKIAEEVAAVTDAGADWIHLDVMDGHFVPPISFGPGMLKAVRSACDLPLDVHLMIERPEQQLEAFRSAGADIITVHYEACPHLHRVLQRSRELGAKAGVALNPSTSVDLLRPLLDSIDLLLIMTVNPGWGGQSFIPSSVDKVARAKLLIKDSGMSIHLQVDGGINGETSSLVCNSGADVLVAGTYIFSGSDYSESINTLKLRQIPNKTA